MKIVSPNDTVSVINSGDQVFVHTAAAAPQILVDAMTGRADEFRNVSVYHLHTEGEAPYVQDEHADTFQRTASSPGKTRPSIPARLWEVSPWERVLSTTSWTTNRSSPCST